MQVFRPVIHHQKVQDALCWLVAAYVRFVFWTGRWTIVGDNALLTFMKTGKPFIVSFWHGRLLMMPFCHDKQGRSVDMLISNHPDGRLISKTVGHLGIGTIAGSTSRGGTKAARELIRRLREENCIIGITPDGPRGPRMRASDGIVALAHMAEVPIFTIAYSTNSGKLLSSWDRFLLPYPFCRGVFAWGKPIHIPKNANKELLESKRIEVEAALTSVLRRCDEMMGRPIVEPAPFPAER
jgi:lysophospholipid acyltransferase (LPLAT)-like uncharacterized protein